MPREVAFSGSDRGTRRSLQSLDIPCLYSRLGRPSKAGCHLGRDIGHAKGTDFQASTGYGRYTFPLTAVSVRNPPCHKQISTVRHMCSRTFNSSRPSTEYSFDKTSIPSHCSTLTLLPSTSLGAAMATRFSFCPWPGIPTLQCSESMDMPWVPDPCVAGQAIPDPWSFPICQD